MKMVKSTIRLQKASIKENNIKKTAVQGTFGYPFGDIDINANLLWKEGYLGRGIKVAVLDTGIAPHSDFQNRIVYRKSFAGEITDPHGTHVAGTIGASAKDGNGIYGVAPEVSLYDLQILGKAGGSDTSFSQAIDEAIAQDVDILNLSIGTPDYSSKVDAAVKRAHNAGILIVAAAGNAGPGSKLYPGIMNECVSVGNYDVQAGRYNSTTSSNVYVDVAAPGTKIMSTVFNNGYASLTGSSMAVPYVSGLCALYMEKIRKESSLGKSQLRDAVLKMLMSNLVDVNTPGFDQFTGNGLVRYQPGTKPSFDYVAKNTYVYYASRLY